MLRAVVRPTARVARPAAAAATVALAGVPALVMVARSGRDLTAVTVLLALGAGASLAWASEDPAADLLTATPFSSAARLVVRLLAVVVVAAGVVGVVLAAVAVGPGLPGDLGLRPLEALAATGVAVAVGLGARARGDRAPGPSGVLAGLLVPGLVAALAVRWPQAMPTFIDGPVHGRWWYVALMGAGVAGWLGRDPATRGR